MSGDQQDAQSEPARTAYQPGECVDCWHRWGLHKDSGCSGPACPCTEASMDSQAEIPAESVCQECLSESDDTLDSYIAAVIHNHPHATLASAEQQPRSKAEGDQS